MESAPEFAGSKRQIAFFAVVSAGSLGDVGANEIIVFDKAVTNVGEGYNAQHGHFTAPVAGLYQFSASIMADNGKEVWTRFTLNNDDVAYIYARGTDDRHDQGSQTIILKLKQGDIVSVKNQKPTRIYGDTYTTFSGFLLG